MEDTRLSPRYSLWRSARLSRAQLHKDWLGNNGGMYWRDYNKFLKELEKTDESIDTRGINPD